MNPILRAAIEEYKELRNRQKEIEIRAEKEKAALRPRLEQLETFLRIADTIKPIQQESLPQPSDEIERRTFKDSVISTAILMLRGGAKAHTREIVAELERRGVTVPGGEMADKVLRVSLVLSREKDQFESNRMEGWSIKPPMDANDAVLFNE